MNMKKPSGWMRMKGIRWLSTMSTNDSEPASSSTPTIDSTSGTS